MRGDIDLTGRQAFVTGGTRGLGRRIAKRLDAAGACIAITDHPKALAAASNLPRNWESVAVDLTAANAEEALAAAIGGLDRLDILIANAGVVPPWRGVFELDLVEWERVFRINVTGIAMVLKTAAPRLAESGHGSAVLMASINAYRAHPQQILYTATKHAVLGLMRAAALDLGRSGVRVNALAPGPIATDALKTRVETRHTAGGPSPDEAFATLAGETALGRIATEDDVADTALYLASDLSRAVTGTLLPVECGLT
ncbi:MAG: SDR family NAD(P)-dependent oxidoreductase [Geminicoccaceae bacterium]